MPVYDRSRWAFTWLNGIRAGVVNKTNVHHEIGLLGFEPKEPKKYDNFILLRLSVGQEIKIALCYGLETTD